MTDKQRKRYEQAKEKHQVFMKVYPLTLECLQGECWVPIPNFEDTYCVSNFGRVKRLYKSREPRIIKPTLDKDGYLQIGLNEHCKKTRAKIHRLVARAFIPNPDGKPQINHIDGCKFNNYVGNLEWATNSENQRHALFTGLRKPQKGEGAANAKLTNEQARFIRENPDNLTAVELAIKFNVDDSTINAIQLGWSYQTAGGKCRQRKHKRTPDDIREKIRAEYKSGVHGAGSYVLARKYGIGATTIRRIVHEQD